MKNMINNPHLFISLLLIILGIFSFLSLIIVNPIVLRIISADNIIEQITIDNIFGCQQSLIIIGIILTITGWMSYKYDLFRVIRNKNVVSLLLSVLPLIWIIITTEVVLRIPTNGLRSSKELLDMSIPFELSSFSRHQLGRFDHEWKDLNGNRKAVIRNGYRGDPFTFEKKEDEIRIFILGGSQVFDIGNGYRKDWPHRIQESLHNRGFTNVNIINAGTPGHGSWDCVGRLWSEIHMLSPDYVIICNSWNDIKYFHVLSPEYSLLKKYPGMINATHKPSNKLITLLERSKIYIALKQLKNRKLISQLGLEGKIPPDVNLKETYGKWGVDQFKLNLEIFINICKDRDIVPVLCTQPRLVSKENTESEKKLIARCSVNTVRISHESLCKAFSDCDSVILDISNKECVPLLDLSKSFTGIGVLFVDPVHLTEIGSKRIAEYSADFIEELLVKK